MSDEIERMRIEPEEPERMRVDDNEPAEEPYPEPEAEIDPEEGFSYWMPPDGECKKSPLGRPTLLNEIMVQRLKTACLSGAGLNEIANLCQIAIATLYTWRSDYAELKIMMDYWSAKARQTPVTALMKRVREGHWPATKFYLEKRHPDFRKKDDEAPDEEVFDPDESFM